MIFKLTLAALIGLVLGFSIGVKFTWFLIKVIGTAVKEHQK